MIICLVIPGDKVKNWTFRFCPYYMVHFQFMKFRYRYTTPTV